MIKFERLLLCWFATVQGADWNYLKNGADWEAACTGAGVKR